MCNIYREIQNTTYYVQHLSRNSKYNLLCVTFIVEYKIQPIMCNIYQVIIWNIVEYKIQPIMCNVYRGIQNTSYYV